VSGRSRVPKPAAKISALVMHPSMPESSPRSPLAWYPGDEMSYFRSLSATLLSAAATFSIVTASCGTNAVGVDDCRDIEQARCRASASCLDADGVPLIQDVPACERYYRDHCLHGFAVKPPAGADVAGCIQLIEQAGRCAQEDPDSELGCTDTASARRTGFTSACDVVTHPERAVECAFLLDTPEDEGSAGQGSGGQTSSDTSSGATSGQGAAAGETAQAGAGSE
jgi:hypothetical protein